MSFPRYERYKDSGVEWLGEVPEHWAIAALNYHYDVALGKMLDEKRITGEHLAPYLRNVDVQWGRVNTADLPEMDFKGDDLERYSLRKGDLLVCEGGEVGRAAIWRGELAECYYQKALHRLRPKDSANEEPGFMFYHLCAAALSGRFVGSEGKSTISHLTAEALRRYQFGFPPQGEQSVIATFLDRETAKIDALIAEQQRLIELLKEKRQAVISHAVTKGLNPDAPMKDSGIEWLGEVPAHWEVKPMRMIANIVRGASPRPAGDPRYFGGNAMPWVTVAEITKDDTVYLTETDNFLTDEGAAHSNLFPKGTLIYSNSGATLGVPKILCIDACANDGVIAFLNIDDQVQPEFIYHYLSSITDSIREKVKQGSGQPNLNTDIVKGLRFGVPSLNEQHKVVERITELAQQFGVLTAEAQTAITLLQERRTALISAAVTGKIDVRGVAGVQAPNEALQDAE